jgi:hypothetical protein
MKTRFAGAENVQTAILQAIGLYDSGGDSYSKDRVFVLVIRAFLKQHEAKDVRLIDTPVDHELVSILKDVQGDSDLWKQNEVRKRE